MKSATHLILLLVATIVTIAHCRPDKSIVLMILDHGLDEPCDKDGQKDAGKDGLKESAKGNLKDNPKEGLKDAAKEGLKEALKEAPNAKDGDDAKFDDNAAANDSPSPVSRGPKKPQYQRAPRIRNNNNPDSQGFH